MASAVTVINGKYRVDARLGGGGMAEVFVGSTLGVEGFARPIAIKRILPGYSNNPQFARMFVSEAHLTSQLAHPNIVSVLDFDRDEEGRLFLVMELVDGCSLDALCATGLLPFEVVTYVIGEMLRGLGYAHDLPVGGDVRGVIHRDVSPHNVLLSWEGAVKVSDFGIAKARDVSEAMGSALIKGKPAYMSPEQANGEALDGGSDLFAVGVIMWEMLVGRRLFLAEDTRATLAAVLFGTIPRPRALRPEVPRDLEKIVMRLLQRDRSERYSSAESAIAGLVGRAKAADIGSDVLRRILSDRLGNVRQRSRHSGLVGEAADLSPDLTRTQVVLRRTLRRALWALAAACALGVLVAVYLLELRVDGGLGAPPNSSTGITPQTRVATSTDGGLPVDAPRDAGLAVDAQRARIIFVDPSNLPSCIEYAVRLRKLLPCVRKFKGYYNGNFGSEVYLRFLTDTMDALEGYSIDAFEPGRADLRCKAGQDGLVTHLPCDGSDYSTVVPGIDGVLVNGAWYGVQARRPARRPKYMPQSCADLIRLMNRLAECDTRGPEYGDMFASGARITLDDLLGIELEDNAKVKASKFKDADAGCHSELRTMGEYLKWCH